MSTGANAPEAIRAVRNPAKTLRKELTNWNASKERTKPMTTRTEKGINIELFTELCRHINEHHSMGTFSGKKIKYMRPAFDFRTGRCFYIRFEGMFQSGNKDFYTVNEWRDHPKSLHARVMDWLNDVPDTYEPRLSIGADETPNEA